MCYIPRACKQPLVALSDKLNISPAWAWRGASGPQRGARVTRRPNRCRVCFKLLELKAWEGRERRVPAPAHGLFTRRVQWDVPKAHTKSRLGVVTEDEHLCSLGGWENVLSTPHHPQDSSPSGTSPPPNHLLKEPDLSAQLCHPQAA